MSSKLEQLHDIVDENDNVIGQVTRAETDTMENIIIRSAMVFLFNDEGQVALQMRAKQKSGYPSHWDCSAGGCVDAGESYDVAVVRETEEEIGVALDIDELEFMGKELYRYDEAKNNLADFIAIYRGTYNGDFVVEEEEVEHMRWVTMDELRCMIEAGEPFHPETLYVMKKYLFAGE